MGKFSVLNFAWKKRENSAVEAIKIRSRVDSLKNMKILVDSFGKKREKNSEKCPNRPLRFQRLRVENLLEPITAQLNSVKLDPTH